MIVIVSNAHVVSASKPPRNDIINFHGSTGVTSLAVSFLRLIFGGIVVASTEFGGKFVVEIDDGVGVEFVVELVVDVKTEIGVEVESIDVFEDDERS
jgi:hypothetical protein